MLFLGDASIVYVFLQSLSLSLSLYPHTHKSIYRYDYIFGSCLIQEFVLQSTNKRWAERYYSTGITATSPENRSTLVHMFLILFHDPIRSASRRVFPHKHHTDLVENRLPLLQCAICTFDPYTVYIF